MSAERFGASLARLREPLQRSRWTPWIGLVAPPVAWALHRRVIGDLVLFDCRMETAGVAVLVGLTLGLIAAVSAAISWGSRIEANGSMWRPLASRLGALAGAVFCLAMALQTLSTLLLPLCRR